jgi:hypothetical protein
MIDDVTIVMYVEPMMTVGAMYLMYSMLLSKVSIEYFF